MFPESHGFVAMTVTSCVKDTCSNLDLSIISEGIPKLFDLVTGIATKQMCAGAHHCDSHKTCYQVYKHAKMDARIS